MPRLNSQFYSDDFLKNLKLTFQYIRNNQVTNINEWHFAFRATRNISIGKYEKAKQHINSLLKRKNKIAYYYLAIINFVHGNYNETVSVLDQFIDESNNSPDYIYLKAESLLYLGEKDKAWRELEGIAYRSKRLKTWLIMANAVESNDDFSRLQQVLKQAVLIGTASALHLRINEYVAMAALRCKNYEYSTNLWRISYIEVQKNPSLIRQLDTKKKKFTTKNASQALSSLKHVLQKADIELFLISGTLLGCIRENHLLTHDKDIDVGIWDSVDKDYLLSILRTNGFFYVQASRSSNLIRIKHINGTPIDIFLHQCKTDGYWHGGAKLRWHNTAFTLTPIHFLNETYLIPADYETYLTENYGNWHVPQINFDSTYDTPNAAIENTYELIAYTYKKLIICQDNVKTAFYRNILSSHGEILPLKNHT